MNELGKNELLLFIRIIRNEYFQISEKTYELFLIAMLDITFILCLDVPHPRSIFLFQSTNVPPPRRKQNKSNNKK